MPGEAGNFAVAVTAGGPLQRPGQSETAMIVVETQSEWVTYRVLPIDCREVRRPRPGAA